MTFLASTYPGRLLGLHAIKELMLDHLIKAANVQTNAVSQSATELNITFKTPLVTQNPWHYN